MSFFQLVSCTQHVDASSTPSNPAAITPPLLTLFCPELYFSVGSASEHSRPSSKLRDGNQTGCLGACGSLNYFCLEPAVCAGRANALVCRAFCHAHFSTLGSITNEMLSVRWPAGFQPAVSLFITSSCSAHVLLFSSSILVGWRQRSKAQRTLFSFSWLYVETRILDNPLRGLCMCTERQPVLSARFLLWWVKWGRGWFACLSWIHILLLSPSPDELLPCDRWVGLSMRCLVSTWSNLMKD